MPGLSPPGLTVSILPNLITNLSAIGRDLKLENLLLDRHDNVKISDFGFAKIVTANQTGHGSSSYCRTSILSHLSQTYCGSFAYSCPEILRGLPYNPFLSDTWSMGVILYTLVVAHLPFDDTNLKKLLRGTQKEVTFPPNHTISPECKVRALPEGLGLYGDLWRAVNTKPRPLDPGERLLLQPGHLSHSSPFPVVVGKAYRVNHWAPHLRHA